MERRSFLGRSIAGGIALGGAPALSPSPPAQAPGRRPSDLPSQLTPTAYANRSSGYSPFTTPDYYTYA
ncbi:MAG: hypothetical protein HY238_25270, partial [Acidobacteria bacterium]|nr:hypothetical protein [Acidobacteriota bacterium]